MIQLNEVSKYFKDEEAVKHLSFSVSKGEIFGFLGPSGAGKTTTINMMIGRSKVSKGSLNILNHTTNELNHSHFKQRIGVMSDHSTLYHRLTVYENLKLYADIYQVSSERINETLGLVGLTKQKKKRVSKLSSGMKQRVLLARAIIHEPTLLFLDEPTANLDPTTSKMIHQRLTEMNDKGTTIFITTHDMEEATTLCDRVAFLVNGEIKLIGNPNQLRFQYAKPELNIITTQEEQLTLPQNETTGEYIKTLLTQQQLKYIASDLPSLGDIFLNITGEELESNETISN